MSIVTRTNHILSQLVLVLGLINMYAVRVDTR